MWMLDVDEEIQSDLIRKAFRRDEVDEEEGTNQLGLQFSEFRVKE